MDFTPPNDRVADEPGVAEVGEFRETLNERGWLAQTQRSDGTYTAVAYASRDVDGSLRLETLVVERSPAGQAAASKLIADLEASDVRPAWHGADESLSTTTTVDLLAPGDGDAPWAAAGRSSASDFFAQHRQREREALVKLAESRLALVAGEQPPDLAGRVAFLAEAEFDDRFPNHDDTLGMYFPGSRQLVVRDRADADTLSTLLHEGLHALRHERASTDIPLGLDEAITEHLTRRIDPANGAVRVERAEIDGKVVYTVPGLDHIVVTDAVEVHSAPVPYGDRLATVTQLEATVGKRTLWEYYRTGCVAGIRDRYDEAHGLGAWARLVDDTEHGRWRKEP